MVDEMHSFIKLEVLTKNLFSAETTNTNTWTSWKWSRPRDCLFVATYLL